MSRRLINRRALVAVTAVAALGLATGFVVIQKDSDADADDVQEVAAATAQVERRTLAETETVDGILDFGKPQSLTAGRSGILTTVTQDDSVVERGGELFSVNLHPTILLYGEIPFYRDLHEGVPGGQDIVQLQENLIALGFDDGGSLEADGTFDASTRRAVEAWQESLEREETGVVASGDVAFLPGAVRVAGAQQPVGAMVQPGGGVLEYTSTSQEVRADLEIDQGDLATVDDTVEVILPDGTRAAGTVTETAHRSSTSGDGGDDPTGGGGSGSDDTSEPRIEVTISLDDPEAAGDYVSTNVEVVFTRAEVEDALTVPVTALLAVDGGGYAVELTGGRNGTTTLVAVEPGTFADGYVEISGDIEQGDEVVVPA